MIQIPLINAPNQSFSIMLNNNQYDISINANRDNGEYGTGIMSVTIYRDNILIVSGVRAVAGFPIIASEYLENGNFTFVTQNDEYPAWQQFGITQSFVFASQAELGAL